MLSDYQHFKCLICNRFSVSQTRKAIGNLYPRKWRGGAYNRMYSVVTDLIRTTNTLAYTIILTEDQFSLIFCLN